jgi:hypothetical protein
MRVGDSVTISGEDGSTVEIGKDDEFSGGVFIAVRDSHAGETQEVSLSRQEAFVLYSVLGMVL